MIPINVKKHEITLKIISLFKLVKNVSYETLFKALQVPTEGWDTFRAQVPSVCLSPVRSCTNWVVSILPCLELEGKKTAKAAACLETSVLQQNSHSNENGGSDPMINSNCNMTS